MPSACRSPPQAPRRTTSFVPANSYDSSLGSLYLRARYYRLPTGRFLTIDPYEGDILNPATLHKYVYTRNNPVNRIDALGTDDIGEEGVLLKNLTKNEAYAARKLRIAKKALRCAVEALKQDIGVGYGLPSNPDVFIDVTNGNVFGPAPTYEFLGSLKDYLP